MQRYSDMIWTRFNKDEHVSDEYAFMETVAKICDVLACGVDDILEFGNIH